MKDVECEAEEDGLVVPWEALSPEALRNVLEEFATREGTDYGAGGEVDLDTKIAQLRRQLETGDVVLSWSTATETVSLVTKRELADTRPGCAANPRASRA